MAGVTPGGVGHPQVGRARAYNPAHARSLRDGGTSDEPEGRWNIHPRTLALIYGTAVLLLAGGLLLHLLAGFSLNEVSRDPLATAELHPLIGAQSTVGVLIWWSAASVSLAASAVLRRQATDRSLSLFLLWSGLITALLALDDAFQFHDYLGADWFSLRERYIIVGYALVLALYFVVFRKRLWRSERLLLALAFVFAGLSVAGDFVAQQFVEDGVPSGTGEVLNYLEDAMKLLAIVSWSAWLIRYSLAALRDPWRVGETTA